MREVMKMDMRIGAYRVGDILKIRYMDDEVVIRITPKTKRSVVVSKFKKWFKKHGLNVNIID